MRYSKSLDELQAGMRSAKQSAKQLRLNFERRRRIPESQRHSDERACDVERLLELAARVPNVHDLRSPIQSGLCPQRFQSIAASFS